MLAEHVGVYSLCFLPWGWKFALLTFLTHYLTDACTSRLTSKLWFFTPTGMFYNIGYGVDDPKLTRYEMWIPKGGSRHWFFVAIGFDQLIHYATLAITYKILIG